MSNGRERVHQALQAMGAEDVKASTPKVPAQQPPVKVIDLLQLLAMLARPTPEEKRKIMFIQIVEENLLLKEDMKYRDAGYGQCEKCQFHHVAP